MRDFSTPPSRPTVVLPSSLKVAGIGRRIAAWLIDTVIFGALQIAFWLVAVALGVISVSPEAERQLQASPLSVPTVPPYQTNLPALAAILVLFVAVCVVYSAMWWALFRGLPGQKLLSLQVADEGTGRNLSFRRATARALVAVGVPMAAAVGLIFSTLAFEATVPWSDIVQAQSNGSTSSQTAAWSGLLLLATAITFVWPVLLLIWTITSPMHQGLHDRLARSLVVANRTTAPYVSAGWPGYGAGSPGYGAGYGPGYGQSYGPGFLPGYGPGYAAPPSMPGASSAPAPGQVGGAPEPSTQPGTATPAQPETGGPAPLGWSQPEARPQSWSGAPKAGPVWTIPDGESDAPPKLHAATVGRRVAGYLFDCVIVYMAFEVIGRLLEAAFLPPTATALDERSFILIALVAGFAQMAYFTASWAVFQGTLGQRMMHMRVSDATTGKALGWIDAMVRWAVLQGPFALATIVPEAARIPILLTASSWALYLFYTTSTSPDVRGLHDRFLNSRVALEP